MDLDNFKIINDTFGHAAGDKMIREIGEYYKEKFPKNRYCGAYRRRREFAVVFKNTSLEEAKKVAEKFRETVAKRKVVYSDHEISFTVSIGVTAIHGNIRRYQRC